MIGFAKLKIDLVKDLDLWMGSADLTDRQKSDLDRDLRSFAIRSSIPWFESDITTSIIIFQHSISTLTVEV